MLEDIRNNPIMLTDGYNLSHEFLKVNTDWEVSHLYNRAKPMILYGLLENMYSVLSTRIEDWMIVQARNEAYRKNMPFPEELWIRVVNECNGYLPLQIQMLPEGTYCPAKTPFAQIRNTVKGFGELVTWLEGVFLQSSFASSAATQAFRMRKYLEQKKEQYGFDDSFLWKFHSFGFRGHKSLEDAYWAGTAWNMFLHGTDDFHIAVHMPDEIMMGSIMAQGHKVTQQFDDEFDSFIYAIHATHKKGKDTVALVIDTYDAMRVINEYAPRFAKYAKSLGVHVVLRPDSGDTWEQAVTIYQMTKRHDIDNISVILGENMDFENAKKADSFFEMHGVPLDFVFYGLGGGFFNYITRNTLGWAMKTGYSNGKDRMKFSEDSFKQSIPGMIDVVADSEGNMVVVREGVKSQPSLYVVVYHHDTSETPYVLTKVRPSHFVSVRDRALAQRTNQHIIIIDDAIKEDIEDFRLTYKK